MNATTFQLGIDMEEIARFQENLESLLTEAHFSGELVHDLSLVSEELLVNIISYGYPLDREKGVIEVTVQVGSDGAVLMEFRDKGIAFDPLSSPERDPEDERVGGWGIPMLKAFSDQVRYRREGEYNVLSLSRSERDS